MQPKWLKCLWNDCWHQTWWFEYLKLLILWDFHAQQSLEFTENSVKNILRAKNPRLVNERGQSRIGGLVQADRKAAVTQNTSYNSAVQKKAPWKLNMYEPWSGWAIAAEDHTDSNAVG